MNRIRSFCFGLDGLMRRAVCSTCVLMMLGSNRVSAVEYSPFNLGGFETTASLGLGGIFRDNLLFQPTDKIPAIGTEISPTIVATRSGTIGTTNVFGSIDAGIFPGHSLGDYSQYLASISHQYAARKDLNFTGGLSFNHQDGTPPNPNGLQTSINLANYSVTSYQANGSVEKDFGPVANVTSANAIYTTVPNNNVSSVVGLSPLTTLNPTSNISSTTPSLFASLPQGATQTISLTNRTAYNLAPLLIPSLTENFSKSFGAYRQTVFGGQVGLQIGRIGLFTSNVYAGAQAQNSSNLSSMNTSSTVSSSTYNAGLSTTYDFRRYLIFTFQANASYGALALPTVGANFAQNNGQAIGGGALSGGVSGAGPSVILRSNNTLTKNFEGTALYTFFARTSINASVVYNEISIDQQQPTTIFGAQLGLDYSLTAASDLNISYSYTRATGLQALALALGSSANAALNKPIEVNMVRFGARHRF